MYIQLEKLIFNYYIQPTGICETIHFSHISQAFYEGAKGETNWIMYCR